MLKIKVAQSYFCFQPFGYQVELAGIQKPATFWLDLANLPDNLHNLKIGDELELVKKETK